MENVRLGSIGLKPQHQGGCRDCVAGWISELQLQRETLSPKVRWIMIEVDTYCWPQPYTPTHTRVHTHTKFKKSVQDQFFLDPIRQDLFHAFYLAPGGFPKIFGVSSHVDTLSWSLPLSSRCSSWICGCSYLRRLHKNAALLPKNTQTHCANLLHYDFDIVVYIWTDLREIQIRSVSGALGARTSRYALWEHIQTLIPCSAMKKRVELFIKWYKPGAVV